MVTEKLKERLMDEIEFSVFCKEPPMLDKRGSEVAIKLCRRNAKLKADFVNKNSETLEVAPL